MRGSCRLVATGLALALAGCAVPNQQGAPYTIGAVSLLPAGPIGFHCPTGVKQWFSNGGWVAWSGSDPADAGVCNGTNGKSRAVKTALGVLNPDGSEAGSLQVMTAAMTELASKAPGTTIAYTLRSGTASKPGAIVARDHTLRVLGAQEIATPAGNFHTIVVEDGYTNSAGDMGSRSYGFTAVRWVDAETGLLVKLRSVTWDSSFTEWTTIKIEKS